MIQLLPSVERVEGRSTFEPVPQQWFRCRLSIIEGSKTGAPPRSDAALAFRSKLLSGQLLCITVDLDDNPLVFRNDQRLDISSVQLGRAIWRNENEPQPLRKKRKLIGWTLSVERVIEREFDDLLNEMVPHPDLSAVDQTGLS